MNKEKNIFPSPLWLNTMTYSWSFSVLKIKLKQEIETDLKRDLYLELYTKLKEELYNEFLQLQTNLEKKNFQTELDDWQDVISED